MPSQSRGPMEIQAVRKLEASLRQIAPISQHALLVRFDRGHE